MQEFRCPWCGDRPQIEFTYYYEAEAVPGREWLSDDEGQELDRIHLRTNIHRLARRAVAAHARLPGLAQDRAPQPDPRGPYD